MIKVSEPPTPVVKILEPDHGLNPPSATKQKIGLSETLGILTPL